MKATDELYDIAQAQCVPGRQGQARTTDSDGLEDTMKHIDAVWSEGFTKIGVRSPKIVQGSAHLYCFGPKHIPTHQEVRGTI